MPYCKLERKQANFDRERGGGLAIRCAPHHGYAHGPNHLGALIAQSPRGSNPISDMVVGAGMAMQNGNQKGGVPSNLQYHIFDVVRSGRRCMFVKTCPEACVCTGPGCAQTSMVSRCPCLLRRGGLNVRTTETSQENHNAQAARIKRHPPFKGVNIREWSWGRLEVLPGVRVIQADELESLAAIVDNPTTYIL